MEKDGKKINDRRNFLKLVGLGTVSGGVALVADHKPSTAADNGRREGELYQESAHVKTYYDLARN